MNTKINKAIIGGAASALAQAVRTRRYIDGIPIGENQLIVTRDAIPVVTTGCWTRDAIEVHNDGTIPGELPP